MTKQHTPGPWRVEFQEGDKPYIVADQGKKWNNPTICDLFADVTPSDSVTVGPWLEAHDNAQANAALIAAAPELLNFAKRLELTLRGNGLIERELLELIHQESIAVIAKAGGAA